MKSDPYTTAEFINYAFDLLRGKNISDPRLNAELILCEVLKCDRVKLYLNFDKPLSKQEINLLNEYLSRRVNYEPVQHILGKTSFFGFDIRVNDKVLIPRPETELLTEKILEDIRNGNKKSVSIFEIGAGSGCIPVALAKTLEKEKISFDIFSIDISQPAIELANENLRINNLSEKKIKFVLKDVFEIGRLTKNFDYIISNPPYISNDEFDLLEPEVRKYEPAIALTDFQSGLSFFKRIFLIASDKLFNGRVFCEIGFGQKEEIEKLLTESDLNDYLFFKDYNNIDRILKVVK